MYIFRWPRNRLLLRALSQVQHASLPCQGTLVFPLFLCCDVTVFVGLLLQPDSPENAETVQQLARFAQDLGKSHFSSENPASEAVQRLSRSLQDSVKSSDCSMLIL